MALVGRSRVLVAGLLCACLAGCGDGSEQVGGGAAASADAGLLATTGPAPDPGSSASRSAVEVPGGVELLGTAEVPGPGDPEGAGRAVVAVVAERNEVCVEIEVRGLDQPIAAHLHEGAPGMAGDVVLGLPSPAEGDGSVDACVSAAADVIDRLVVDPGAFYVNVHSEGFPDGALRGQLDEVTAPVDQP